ncbi:MAG: hypothetical protein ACPGXK_04855, partial [Phycisphaerae bacterium]
MSTLTGMPHTSHQQESMSYARSRLWLGITSVGTMVTVAIALLALNVPATFYPTEPGSIGADIAYLFTALVAYVLISLPFDLFGGFVLPQCFGRLQRSFGSFFQAWIRGVVVQSLFMLLTAICILIAARTAGLMGAIVAASLGMILMVAFQRQIAQLCAHLPERFNTGLDLSNFTSSGTKAVVINANDVGFIGG